MLPSTCKCVLKALLKTIWLEKNLTEQKLKYTLNLF